MGNNNLRNRLDHQLPKIFAVCLNLCASQSEVYCLKTVLNYCGQIGSPFEMYQDLCQFKSVSWNSIYWWLDRRVVPDFKKFMVCWEKLTSHCDVTVLLERPQQYRLGREGVWRKAGQEGVNRKWSLRWAFKQNYSNIKMKEEYSVKTVIF